MPQSSSNSKNNPQTNPNSFNDSRVKLSLLCESVDVETVLYNQQQPRHNTYEATLNQTDLSTNSNTSPESNATSEASHTTDSSLQTPSSTQSPNCASFFHPSPTAKQTMDTTQQQNNDQNEVPWDEWINFNTSSPK